MSPLKNYNLPNAQRRFGFTGLFGLLGIAIAFSTGNFILSGGIILFPLLSLFLLHILEKPVSLLYTTFILNYFIIGMTRYVKFEGISIIMDALLISQLILICIHGALKQNIQWKNSINTLTVYTVIWMIYCILQLVNPTGVAEGWILSRGLIFNGLIISLIAIFLITDVKNVKAVVYIYSVLTIVGAGKAMMQKFIGFDFAEQAWLAQGGALTHIIGTGTRYFSFFTDAGNLGSNMGCSGVVFAILAFHSSSKKLKVYFLLVSSLAIYAMFLSGTRGAMIVPLGGIALYSIVSKSYKSMAISAITLIGIYIFFAFTFIGQGNAQIRRMRSSFQPTEDASFNVRRDNQKILAVYLKNKPFGEGLGLSGVENQKIANRLTTTIPHDSWYVKIWVETGIVGAILYLGGLLLVVGNCIWIIMFRIRDKELKGICSGLICGIFGMLLSAYGNAFWGQYPTMIIAFIGLSICINAKSIEENSTNKIITTIQP